MALKMAASKAPPPIVKTPNPEGVPKDLPANQDNLKKNELGDKTEEYGYIVTNQRWLFYSNVVVKLRELKLERWIMKDEEKMMEGDAELKEERKKGTEWLEYDWQCYVSARFDVKESDQTQGN